MASKTSTAKKYELHRKLYNIMKDTLTQEEFEDLKRLCKDQYLRGGVVERIKDVTDLLDALEKKGKIGIERGYKTLKDLLTESGLENEGLITDIIDTEQKMRQIDIEDVDVFEEPRPASVYGRSGFEIDNHKRRISDRRISDPGMSLEVKRKRLSRTESDADPDNIYLTNPDHKSLLLIIDQFTQQRQGSDVDRNALDQLFRADLGFEVLTFKDLNKENFQEKLSHMANYIAMSPFQYDRLFVAILSHGDKNGIKTCKDPMTPEVDKYMSIEEIIAPFKSVKLPKMAGKPKVFLIQACQGDRVMDGVEVDGEVRGRTKQPPGRLVRDLGGTTHPNDADFLICNATTQNHVSYRDTLEGSWFIQTLVRVFSEQWKNEDVLSMMTEINRRISVRDATPEGEQSNPFSQPKKQVPCQISTLNKKILLTSANL